MSPVGAKRTFCSWGAGWRSVLLREYRDPVCVDDYTTTPTPDQKLVLVTAGACHIEAHGSGAWHGAAYRPGHIGLVPPGEAARLRWRGTKHHCNIQLHVPGAMIAGVAADLFGTEGGRVAALRRLSMIDPVVATTMLAIDRAARTGAPELYAETAAHFIVSHLLLRHSRSDTRRDAVPDGAAMRRVEDYLRANLARAISLAELAEVAGVSRFQLLRMAKRSWSETPQRHLTRIRMQFAQRLLLAKGMTITQIALECGYSSPAHFATAFRRFAGLTPSQFCQNR